MRLAHWLLAFSVIALIATGWLIKLAPGVAEASSDYHRLAGTGLILGLILRIWLLLSGTGPAHWKALVPEHGDVQKIGMMLRFYMTGGKSPLPKWYAHNPLWAPVYFFILIVLVLQAMTGLLMEAYPVIWRFYLPSVHAFWAPVILVFSCLHFIAVMLNDAKGTGSDVSAMINGHRIFVVDDVDTKQAQDFPAIPIDRIGKPR